MHQARPQSPAPVRADAGAAEHPDAGTEHVGQAVLLRAPETVGWRRAS